MKQRCVQKCVLLGPEEVIRSPGCSANERCFPPRGKRLRWTCFKKRTNDVLSGTCWRILVLLSSFIQEMQTDAQSCSAPNKSVLSVCGVCCCVYVLAGGCRGKGACCSSCPAATVTAAQTRSIKYGLKMEGWMDVLACVHCNKTPQLFFFSCIISVFSCSLSMFVQCFQLPTSQTKYNLLKFFITF